MARKLLRQLATIGTAVLLAAGLFVGLGLWRRSGDAEWCRQAAAGSLPAGEKRLTPGVLDDVHSACIVQRQRQRSFFGAIWRTGGQEAARCGFELARLQLSSVHDPEGHRAVLERYGVDDSAFEVSSREGQDRFVKACLSSSAHGPGR
ncbi:MAG TPA: hypothetical protein VJS45_07555 [Acidimicrobiia bacterium]|nr:hypothetical protein [Acidimicrobiia bacterium]